MSWSQRPDSIAAALKDLLNDYYDDNLAQSNKEDVTPLFPLSFYDGHIDSRLLLKSVKLLPGIVQYLTEVCNGAVTQMLELDAPDFSKYEEPVRGPPRPFDIAYSVYTHYHHRIHGSIIPFISKLYIHPKDRGWHTCLGFRDDEYDVEGFDNPSFAFTALHGLSLSPGDPEKIKLPDDVFNSIAAGRQKTLLDLVKRHPVFSIWHFFAMTRASEDLLENMRHSPNFQAAVPKTSGLPPLPPLETLPDDGALGLVDLITEYESTRYQTRSRTSKANDTKTTETDSAGTRNAPNIVIPLRTRSPNIYTPKPDHFIQRAWNRAVVNDASFVLFHCGSYQRIGYRHRESQTLYLSELIDTRDSDPAYGTIQMGFHLIGFQDAIGRQEVALQRAQAEQGKKRPSEGPPEDTLRRSKRLRLQKEKVDNDSVKSSRETVQAAMATCHVALVQLNYGPYRSPAPSAFVRIRPSCAPGSFDKHYKQPKRRTEYLPEECFTATIREPPMGNGAVGIVHRVTVDIETQPGRLTSNFLIKFAFTPKRQTKLRNEYAIYEHLAAAQNVEGIVPVHGLFEDVETSTLAMIMTDGGTSLRKRGIDQGDPDEIIVTEAESAAFKRALSSIHRADVRHRDLRPDNLLVDSDNRAYIIDFDLAEVTKRKETLAREVDGLRRLLIGKDYEMCYSAPVSDN